MEQKRIQERIRLRVPGDSRVNQAFPLEDVDGTPEPGRSLVQDVVVRRQEDVETDVGQILRIFVGTREGRIARIGFPGQGELHVADSEVRPGDPVLQMLEKGAVAERLGALGHGPVAHDIPDDEQGNRVRAGLEEIAADWPE